MEVVAEDIQLPGELPKEVPECTVLLEKDDKNSPNNLPSLNTDDLPITPISKKWVNAITSLPNSPQTSLNISLPQAPAKENSGNSSQELNDITLPNTDNLLDINVPKTALLGKEQAKKRLHAFSLAKQNSLSASPLLKKNLKQPKFLLQASDEKYNENGERTEEKFVLIKKPSRKSINPNEKAKAVIEEIEEIKKIESAYLEAIEQGLLEKRHRRSRTRSRSRSRDRHRRHSKKSRRSRSLDVSSKSRRSYEKLKNPRSWIEFKTKGYDFEILANVKSKDHFRNKENILCEKQLLFQTPSLPIHHLVIKCSNGKDRIVPAKLIRFTVKNPKISYSVNEKVANELFTRKTVLDYVPKMYREGIKKISNCNSPSDLELPSKMTTRKWFPKSGLNTTENQTECTVLETSLGLSYLQEYSDEDEKEDSENNTVNQEQIVKNIEYTYNMTDLSENEADESYLMKKHANISKSESNELYEKLQENVVKSVETEVEEKVGKRKKLKKKDKYAKHSKSKRSKHKKKKKRKSSKKDNELKQDRCVRKNSTDDDDKKYKKRDNKMSKRNRRSRSLSIKSKDRNRSTSKDGTSGSTKTRQDNYDKAEEIRKTSDSYKPEKEQHTSSVLSKIKISERQYNDNSSVKTKMSMDSDKFEVEHSITIKKKGSNKSDDCINEKFETIFKENEHDKQSSEKLKSNERDRSKSQESMEEKFKKKFKDEKSKSTRNDKEARKIKCVAEKEFGTPDTEEYYSNWESDVELSGSLLKPSDDSFNQSTSINRSWESEEEPDVSVLTNSDNYLDIPLTKSPFRKERKDKSPPRSLLSKDRPSEFTARDKKYKKDMSPGRNQSSERRTSLRERSPVRNRPTNKNSTRNRLVDFPEISAIGTEFSPVQTSRDEFSPLRNKFSSPIRNEFSNIHNEFLSAQNEFSPIRNDFSPFRNRCPDDRRRSRRPSLERSPLPRTSSEPFLEMPLNIRNLRKGYSRKWEEERFEGTQYEHSPNRIDYGIRNENKLYELYTEDSWERDDYLTEEMRLQEERLTLIEERRKLEIEKRKLEELNRQRFYSPSPSIDDQRCSIENRRQEHFNSDEENRYNRQHRNYNESRDGRQLQTYSKEVRKSDEQRTRRRYSSEKSLEKLRDNFNWEDCAESKKTEKQLNEERDLNKDKSRKRKSRWGNFDDGEFPTDDNQQIMQDSHDYLGNKLSVSKPEEKTSDKEKKGSRKSRWESSEDEVSQSRDDKKSYSRKNQNKLECKSDKDFKIKHKAHSPVKEKHKIKKDKADKQEEQLPSITDNLDVRPQKSFEVKTVTTAQKPELLENEYEKFMQALGSEISTSEDISEKDNRKNKHKFSTNAKLSNRKSEKRKARVRSVSMSSDEEFKKVSKKKVKKRKPKKRVSSSSSSSTSSSSSDSDSTSDSSSTSSSSESSTASERRRKSRKQKLNIKIKREKEDAEDIVTKTKPTVLNNFNSILDPKVVVKIEEADFDLSDSKKLNLELLNSKNFSPNKSMTMGTNLNIINISASDFSLGEIPLPNSEIQKSIVKTSFAEAPLPVPSPKMDVATVKLDPLIPKIEPIAPVINPTLNKSDSDLIHADVIDTALSSLIPEKIPAIPVTTAIPNISPHSSTPEINTEELSKIEENKFYTDENQGGDNFTSPMKRNNLIPIKFLTAEIRKQANETPNVKLVGVIETKDTLTSNTESPVTETKTVLTEAEKSDPVPQFALTNRRRYFSLSTMNLSEKQHLFDDLDNEENSDSIDFTDKFLQKDEKDGKKEEVSTSTTEELSETTESKHNQSQDTFKSCTSPKTDDNERETAFRASPDHTKEKRKLKSISPGRKRDLSPGRKRDLSPRSSKRDRSPRRHDSTRRWGRDFSPRRKERKLSPRGARNLSPRRWEHDNSPRRSSRDTSRRIRDDHPRRNTSNSPRRNSTSPRRKELRRDRRSTSPKKREYSARRRSISRDFSPKRHRSKDRSSSQEKKTETIQEALQRIAGVDKYGNITKHSPISSPVHGFKRSLADSTISDDQLLQRNLDEYTESPSYAEHYKNPAALRSPSPKRMSLDERINQALGLAEQPKPISTTYSSNYEYDQQYFDQYGQYYEQYNEDIHKGGMYHDLSHTYQQSRQRENSNLKVVQVGNVLQVVPTEDVAQKKPVQQNQVSNSTQKIVQVGNMLQIVPTATLPEKSQIPAPTLSVPASTVSPSLSANTAVDTFNAEALIKQKAERRAEKDKRRQERERKRKEKEKKRKERENRKQAKLKLQAEAMIKEALILDTEEGNVEEETTASTNESHGPAQWPPIPQVVFNNLQKSPMKSILSQGLKNLNKGEGNFESHPEKRKSVKFSDGVVPGEGTSPSGGEELSSPPPAPKKLPKEKRFKKTKLPKKIKVPKKKKVKVKVIRQQHTQPTEDDDYDEEDNLPPPPPPPGSPPPHVFPARIKHPVINNIHPNVVVSIANPPLQPPDTSFPPPAYRPSVQSVIMPRHHPHHQGQHRPPHLPPHHGHHHIPPPCPPPHHGGFNPPVVVVPPVISVVPSVPNFGPPSHHHHHHHGGHHQHHHSPHHHHH